MCAWQSEDRPRGCYGGNVEMTLRGDGDRDHERSQKEMTKMLIKSVLAGLAVVCILRVLFVVVDVTGASMIPAVLPGDRLLALRYWPRRLLKRGMVVVVSSEAAAGRQVGIPHASPYLVKRLVGLPGDDVLITGDRMSSKNRLGREGITSEVIRLEDGAIFVVGDSPASTIDSVSLGPFPAESIVAIVLARLPRCFGAVT